MVVSGSLAEFWGNREDVVRYFRDRKFAGVKMAWERLRGGKRRQVLLSFFAIGMVFLAVVGGVRNFTPIPLGDMWDGTLGVVLQLDSGNFSALWAQHNEHRLVLANLLFWVDYAVFGGQSYFLIVLNYLFPALSFAILWRQFRHLKSPDGAGEEETFPLLCFLIAWLFLWIQKENFTWAYQSQFFLAQLLPLLSFCLLARSHVLRSGRLFVAACVVGVVSVGTMANGLLTLPLMVLGAVLLRQGISRVMVLLGLSLTMFCLYFWRYEAPAQHSNVLHTFLHQPLDLLHYVALYLGNPFYYIFGGHKHGAFLAMCAGFVSMACMVRSVIRIATGKSESPYVLALLLFILYVDITAFGTGGGRLIFGVKQSLSSRYTTPVLLAWAAWAIIFWSEGAWQKLSRKKAAFGCFAVLCLAMLIYQCKALRSEAQDIAAMETGALALELQVHDKTYIEKLYPDVSVALHLAQQAREQKLSIFGISPYVGLASQIGRSVSFTQRGLCTGRITESFAIAEAPGAQRVEGWLVTAENQEVPKVIQLLDTGGKVVGVALSGVPGVAPASARLSGEVGFRGYISAKAAGTLVTAMGDQVACPLTLLPLHQAPQAFR